MRPAVAYVRVSTTDQGIHGVSLEAQRALAEQWAQANGCELVAVYQDVMTGKSAAARPQLQLALDHACRERAAVIVYSLSRFARSVTDAYQMSERLRQSGAELVSLKERWDTTTAAGKMIFGMFAVLAAFERDLTAERTAMALAHKVSKGERLGAPPYGWQRGHRTAPDGQDKRDVFEENHTEQSVLSLIGDWESCGMASREIAARLNAAGHCGRGGRQWNRGSVDKILRRIRNGRNCMVGYTEKGAAESAG